MINKLKLLKMKTTDTSILVKARHIAYLLLVVATLLNGCRKELMDEPYAPPYDASKPVSFSAQLDVVTRGTPVNSVDQMTSMGVFAASTGASDWSDAIAPGMMFNTRLNNNKGVWTYAKEDIYWGTKEITDRFTFFAYAPYAEVGADNGIKINGSATTPGIPSLTYTVPTDVKKQPDLMVAARYNMRPVGNVPLQMKHALTNIGFRIAGKGGEKVTGISISGVAVSGDLSIDGRNIVWRNLGVPTNTDFSASLNYDAGRNYYSVTENMYANLIASDGYLMMIPQELGKDAKVTITFADKTTKEINLNGHIWEAGKQISYNISLTDSGSILLTPDYVLLAPALHPEDGKIGQTLTVISQDSKGNPDNKQWVLSAPNPAGWLRLSFDSNDKNPEGSTVSGEGTQTVYIYATRNTSAIREATATLSYNGENVAESRIVQLYENPTLEAVHDRASIVGAFWRHNQTGERIVQVNVGNNTGMWTAKVTFYDKHWDPTNGDGVLLATSGSLDEKLGTDSPEDAEKHQMTGYNYSSSVSGIVGQGEEITFRIGLEKQFTKFKTNPDTYPARYAVIELWYSNHTKMQEIYLRQGEGDDYLMRKSDPPGYGNVTRDNAVRFSPYNQKAERLNEAVNSSNPAIFTEYPSQAGAYFQHASDKNKNYAWDPHNPGIVANWEYTGVAYDLSHEVGPGSYRRPKDDNSIYSEIRQSLWLNYTTKTPPLLFENNDNLAYGYYADGFYDRRSIERSNFTTNGIVDAGRPTVAYGGALFFNPITNASLFFPVGGYRYNTNGKLEYPGLKGYYLTSGNQVLAFQNEGWAAMGDPMGTAGLNLRSVRN